MPTNYILLFIYTLCISWFVGSAVMKVQDPIIVFQAAALTLAIVVSVTIHAATTKSDFTIIGPVCYIFLFITSTTVIFIIIFGPKYMYLLTGIGAFMSSFYLLIDTQMILSGTCEAHRKFSIDEESYIMASLILYMDIINLFLYILELLAKQDNN